MINNKELNEVSLSPTKKDYYQIYNELLDLASKISDRWSPESTNIFLPFLEALLYTLPTDIHGGSSESFMITMLQSPNSTMRIH
jgi:hypothetical protein